MDTSQTSTFTFGQGIGDRPTWTQNGGKFEISTPPINVEFPATIGNLFLISKSTGYIVSYRIYTHSITSNVLTIHNEQYLQTFLMAPTQNTAAPIGQERPMRHRPTTILELNPLQLPQALVEAISAAPATGTAQQLPQRAQTVYRGTYPASRPQMLAHPASATALEVTSIQSRLNWEPVGGGALMYFHRGLGEWRRFPPEEMVEKGDVPRSSARLHKRDMLEKIFSLKLWGGKGGREKKGLTISAPVEESVRYNEL